MSASYASAASIIRRCLPAVAAPVLRKLGGEPLTVSCPYAARSRRAPSRTRADAPVGITSSLFTEAPPAGALDQPATPKSALPQARKPASSRAIAAHPSSAPRGCACAERSDETLPESDPPRNAPHARAAVPDASGSHASAPQLERRLSRSLFGSVRVREAQGIENSTRSERWPSDKGSRLRPRVPSLEEASTVLRLT
jgi:hypothetical protein